MTRLLIGALEVTAMVALAVGLAIMRRQPLRDVFRQEGDGLVVVARGLLVVIVLLAFAVLLVVNNR